jgi:hypothetical protein
MCTFKILLQLYFTKKIPLLIIYILSKLGKITSRLMQIKYTNGCKILPNKFSNYMNY